MNWPFTSVSFSKAKTLNDVVATCCLIIGKAVSKMNVGDRSGLLTVLIAYLTELEKETVNARTKS